MVLAQPIRENGQIVAVTVSIPLWFSLNELYALVRIHISRKFPSHYGSRSTMLEFVIKNYGVTFPSHYGSRSTYAIVSGTDWYIAGFHPTMVLAQQEVRLAESNLGKLVSIPLWFSLNYVPVEITSKYYGFHPTMVLAQPLVSPAFLFQSPVSIPLWFSLNSRWLSPRSGGLSRFHPTMVLAQLAERLLGYRQSKKFPSHYGSRSTEKSYIHI